MQIETEYALPTINIVVIDHNTGQSDRLIRYWLSLDKNSPAILTAYSKIFWAEDNPIQINIYYADTLESPDLPICHAALHLISASASTSINEITQGSILNKHTYECILALKHDMELECSTEPSNAVEGIDYYVSSLTSSNLPTVLNTITRSAYRVARQTYREHKVGLNNQNIGSDPARSTRAQITIPTSQLYCLEDDFYFIDSPDSKAGCCSLL